MSAQSNDDDESDEDGTRNVLDNYDVTNKTYTKGIEISQCSLSGSNQFSIWEFSGYEPYKIFYDHFIGDQNCIHIIVYSLNQSQPKCFKDCVYWLEFLRARIVVKPKSQIILIDNVSSNSSSPTPSPNSAQAEDNVSNSSTSFNRNKLKVILIGTHADLDRSSAKRDDGQFTSDKASRLKSMLESYYINDDLFDLSEKHFVLDARAAWVADIKHLAQHLVKTKQTICERLPKTTMFLNRTLFHLQNWRKSLGSSSNNVHTQPASPPTPLSPAINPTEFSYSVADANKYPVITWKQFIEQIRELINPLASDDHLYELMQQLQLMGEVIFIESDYDHDLICYQPEWLCGKILGRLFSHERYFQVKPNNLNGVYTLAELSEVFADLCANTGLLKDIFLSLDLCAESESERSGELVYEFASLNFLSEPMPLAFHTIKNFAQNNATAPSKLSRRKMSHDKTTAVFVFNGFQIKSSSYHLDKNFKLANSSGGLMSASMTSSAMFSPAAFAPPSQLASLFFRLQVNLRYLTTNEYADLDDGLDLKQPKEDKQQPAAKSQPQARPVLQRNQSKLDSLLDLPPLSATSSSYPSTANTTTNILQSPSLSSTNTPTRTNATPNGATASSGANKKSFSYMESSSNKMNNINGLNGALVDIDLYQTRYCSRLTRKSCCIECLLSLDHENGEFIELRASAPEQWREELFYFVQDLYSLLEQVILDSCSNVNLEKHYLSFKPVLIHADSASLNNSSTNLGLVAYECVYKPRDVIGMQFESNQRAPKAIKFIDLVCCGSENIERNLIHGVDLPFGQLSAYTRRMLCTYLDKTDPMGRDWTILAFLLGVQDFLPKLDETMSQQVSMQSSMQHYGFKALSKTDCVLNEWCKKKPEQASIRYLIGKIADLDRKDVYDVILNTISLFQMNIGKDSGIQNSNQTLASLK